MIAQEEVPDEPVKETQIQPEEELQEVNLGAELGSQKPVFVSSQLATQEKGPLVALLKEYTDVFAWSYDEMPGLDPGLVVHALNVDPGVRPVIQPARVFHTDIEAQITQEVKKLLAAGFIKPIQHPRWLSNVVPVKKKNGQIRCCVDFRNLNKACPKDEFPLPNIDPLVDSAARSSMFSFMDGYSGYNQIRKFLGFLVHHKGISVDPAKAAAIATMKRPTTVKELKSFLGRGAEQQEAFQRVQQIMNHLPTLQAPVCGRPLLLYLASNAQAIGALLAQEDDDGNEQPVYYVSRTLKDAETRYPRIEKACLVVIYASQRLKRYFSAHQILLVTKSHPIKALLHQPLLTGRIAQWLVLLSQYDIDLRTPKAVKSQAIADLLAQFPGKEESSLSEEIPGEVAVAEIPGKKWTMRFDGLATATSNGVGVVLSCENGDTIPLSFKLDFSCSNNAAEYEAYLTGLTIALSIGVKHMRVLGDSNLVVSQVKGDFALREQSLAAYRTWAQRLEREFLTFSIEYTQRSENRFADALATLGSQVPF
nr:uncharacterized protein LOC112030827 [Quercus suber]